MSRAMRMRFNLSVWTTAGFGLALLILIAIGGVSYRSTVRFADSARIVADTHRIIAVLQKTLADLASAESEARGFVITGNEIHLNLYRTAVHDVQTDLRDLDRLTRSPAVRQRLAKLDELAARRLERLEATVATRRLEGLEAVREAAGEGKRLMDALREEIGAIIAMQRQMLAERGRESERLAGHTLAVVVFGSLFAVILAAVGTIVFAYDAAHRARLEREVLDISEREQRRIGQDLHDGLCQHLTGISLLGRKLQQGLALRSDPGAGEAGRLTELVQDGIEQTRRVTRGLHPVRDEPTGLMLALRELCANVTALGGPACRFECPDPVPVPDRTVATHLYRIAQEAVQNALRHAGAGAIAVRLVSDADLIALSVADDGVGLPAHRPRRGMGLEIMDYRARSIGARLEVGRGEGGGTTVSCRMPRDALGAQEEES